MLDNIRIVLVNTSHPGNIGASARAMKNMGLSRLYLVDPAEYPSAEAYSRAAGAEDILHDAVSVPTLAQAVEDCVWVAGTSARLRTVQWPVLTPRDCASGSVEKISQGEVAVVFGRERSGLTNEELELCHALINIPTNSQYSSLNLAAAVQIICYEFRLVIAGNDIQSLKTRTSVEDTLANSGQLEGMYQHLYQTLQDIKFFGGSNPEVIMRRLKSVFNRARPTKREVNILRGIFTAAQNKKRNGKTGTESD